MNRNLGWMTLVVALLGVIVVLLWLLATRPAARPTPPEPDAPAQRQEPPAAQGSQAPLSARVRVDQPKEGASVAASFIVKGEAPGNWYFEASFPVQVRDNEGNVIGRAVAQAKSDWMTTAQVPFEAAVTINSVYRGPAILILLKDNPSGLPEHDDSVSFDIIIQ